FSRDWSSDVCSSDLHALRERGAIPVISPLVDFAGTSEEAKLVAALKQLEEGTFDWLTATTSTIVGVLAHHGAVIHPRTKLAVVGDGKSVLQGKRRES